MTASVFVISGVGSGETRRSSRDRASHFPVFVASVSYTSFISALEFTNHIVMSIGRQYNAVRTIPEYSMG